MKAIIFGGAGFIGSALARKLYSEGNEVTVFDSMYTGKEENLSGLLGKKGFSFLKGDMRKLSDVKKALSGHEFAYHLAANADIRGGMENTFLDFEYNAITTYNVLEAMRLTGMEKLCFTSSSAVYGEPSVFPTPETYGPLRPTSLYGASKLAAEAYVSAFCEDFGMQSWVFRFVNILGSANNHGVVGDFIRKLSASPKKLVILGDGRQQKSSLYITDCLAGMEAGIRHGKEATNIYNIGNDDWVYVDQIADEVCDAMGLSGVEYEHTGGKRGWTGDMPFVFLDNRKLRQTGWKPSMGSRQAVRKAAEEMLAARSLEDRHRKHF
jgi:UDP-glucose 4-epimerase